MSVDFRSVDPKEAWLKVLERLYHEDHILYARMNNFSTVQAFLATALAFTTSGTTTALNISLIVSLFGLALSLFYISLGFRGVRVIQFWRAYLRLLESIPGVTSIDSHLFEFYRLGHRSGPDETELPLASGLAIKIDTSWWARRSVHDQFPWYLPGFSGTMFIAVGIPMLTTTFWLLVLYALFYPHKNMSWFILALAGALVLIFLLHLITGRLVPAPIREGQVPSIVAIEQPHSHSNHF
ncbi:MAG TPA: hypothetical protein VMH20_10900 [Verrucomicrobiae bacterium]|nr:hypothetical protein [Verrucomicrobiae bacterium]